MKSLLIMRHAKSSWKHEDLTDHDRPLNKRGQRDAPRMGRWLREANLLPEMVLSSSAARAVSTAEAIAATDGFDGDVRVLPDLYLGEPQTYLDLVRAADDAHARLMVVGHNPAIEELVRGLTASAQRMPTAAVAEVRFAVERWAEIGPPGELIAVWRPKELGQS